MNVTKHYLLSDDPALLKRWMQFLKSVISQINLITVQGLQTDHGLQGILWVDLSSKSLNLLGAWGGHGWQSLLSNSKLRVIAASSAPNVDEGISTLRTYCAGYIHAYSAQETLVQVCEVIQQGGIWIGKELLSHLFLLLNQQKHPAEDVEAHTIPIWRSCLTSREAEIAECVANGASNKEVMQRFGIRESTVKSHLTRVFNALGIVDRVQLALVVHGKRKISHELEAAQQTTAVLDHVKQGRIQSRSKSLHELVQKVAVRQSKPS